MIAAFFGESLLFTPQLVFLFLGNCSHLYIFLYCHAGFVFLLSLSLDACNIYTQYIAPEPADLFSKFLNAAPSCVLSYPLLRQTTCGLGNYLLESVVKSCT